MSLRTGGGLLMIGEDHDLGGRQRGIHQRSIGASVQIVLQNHHGISLAAAESFQGGVQRATAEQGQPQAVCFGGDQTDGGILLAIVQSLANVGRRLDDRPPERTINPRSNKN